MASLHGIDWLIIVAYMLLVLGMGLGVLKVASQSLERFFVAGRSMPWWLMGVTMASTNFAIDTPIAFTEIVYKEGLAGLSFIWCGSIGAMMITFVFARLWQRSGVLTDVDLVRLRYGDRGAEVLRVFKGVYFGLFFNVFVMGWVSLALLKVSATFTTIDPRLVLAIMMAIVLISTSAGGLFGTAVSDLLRWTVSLTGAVLVAIYAVKHAGGMEAIQQAIQTGPPITASHMNMVPSFAPDSPLPISALFTYLLVQWWANKYSDGAGKHIICMLACRTERDSVLANLMFNIFIQVIHLWPWVIAALAGIVLLGGPDRMNPSLAYPTLMKTVLPTGLLGLVCASLLGAFTAATSKHLTLATAYVVNDLYRPYIKPGASDRHYMFASRVAMVILFALSGALALNMDSVASAWRFLLTFSSGAGLVWILRWFWWRINAWSELSAMIASAVAAISLEYLAADWHFTSRLLATVAFSTLCWLTVTALTRASDDATLMEFLRRVRPARLGWRHLYRQADLKPQQVLATDITDMSIGILFLTAISFAAANAVLLNHQLAVGLFVLSGICLIALLWRIQRRQTAETITTPETAPNIAAETAPAQT